MDRMSTKGQMIDQIDLRGVPHSGFDRSNHNYGTGKLGAIIPARLDEVYPGDRIKGNPEMVVNFEPLAAPLMGSMVLKQESFYVPYPQLWRHAYKFFTGKNGFNDPMPSVSPRDIWLQYEQLHSLIWLGDYNDMTCPASWQILYSHLSSYSFNVDLTEHYSTTAGNKTLREDLLAGLNLVETYVEEIYGGRKMLDLVQPAVDSFKRFVNSKYARDLSDKFEKSEAFATLDEKKAACRDFALRFGDCFEDFFMFFHGPSSLFDYLGWPTVLSADMLYFDIEGDYNRESVFRWLSNYFYNYAGDTTDDDAITFIRNHFSQVPLSFMPFKAYYLIWYWNYRDQLLETGILDPEDDEFLGTSITANVIWYCTLLRQRCWFKDTYTTALTNTGDGNLLVPTDTFEKGPIKVTYWEDTEHELANVTDRDSAMAAGATMISYELDGITYKVPMNFLSGQYGTITSTDGESSFLSLDLFDRIKRLRSFVQKRLVLGYEVDDVIWSSFMVRLSNVRMHIPEILGRGRDAVQINTIVNNTSTDQQIAGDKTATAWAHGKQSEMNYFAEEWGLFLTFTTVMPIQSYAGGMQRLYLKRDRFDFMWPEFATMGMDAVYNCELAALGSRLTDTQGLQVFGYQGRYYDLKSRQDEEHGRLLTDLNYLTFSREWDKKNPPKLNYIFVHCWPRLDGFVVESPLEDVFRYDCYNAHAWERRLPVPSEIVG